MCHICLFINSQGVLSTPALLRLMVVQMFFEELLDKTRPAWFYSSSTQRWRTWKTQLFILRIHSRISHSQFKKTLHLCREVSAWRDAFILKINLDWWLSKRTGRFSFEKVSWTVRFLWSSSACCQAEWYWFFLAFCLWCWLFWWLTGHVGTRPWAHQHPLRIPGSFIKTLLNLKQKAFSCLILNQVFKMPK